MSSLPIVAQRGGTACVGRRYRLCAGAVISCSADDIGSCDTRTCERLCWEATPGFG